MTLPVTISNINVQQSVIGPFKVKNAAVISNRTETGVTEFGKTTTYRQCAQTFTVGDTGFSLKGVGLYLNKQGTPTDDIYVDLRQTDPSGTLIATSEAFSSSLLASGGKFFKILFSSLQNLSANTSYCIVLRRSGAASDTDYQKVFQQNPGTFSGGSEWTYNGTTWTDTSTQDLVFYLLADDWAVEEYCLAGLDSSSSITYRSMKATDPSDSWSSYQTLANGSTAVNYIGPPHRVDDIVHFMSVEGTATATHIRYNILNLINGKFSDYYILTNTNTRGLGDTYPLYWADCVVRSTGEVVTYFNGLHIKASGSYRGRTYISRSSTPLDGGWSTPTLVDAGGAGNDYRATAVALGSSNRVHLTNYNLGTDYIDFVPLDSSNNLGNTTQKAAPNGVADEFFTALSYTVGSDVRVIFPGGPYIWWLDSATPDTITDASGVGGESARIYRDADDSKNYITRLKSTDSDIYLKSSTDDGESWSSETDIYTGTVIYNGLKYSDEIYQRGYDIVLPFIVNDNGVLKYDEEILRSLASGLEPSYFVDTDIFYAPTVQLSEQIITVTARFDDTDVFYAPTIVAQGFIVPQRVDDTDAIYAPTVVMEGPVDVDWFFVGVSGPPAWPPTQIAGPYKASNGYLYAFGRDADNDDLVRVIKAQTAAPNSWESVGTVTFTGTMLFHVRGAVKDDIVHLLVTDCPSSLYNFSYLTFNMETEEFEIGPELISGNVAAQNSEYNGSIVVRSTGEVVVLHQWEYSSGLFHVAYKRRTGTNQWTTAEILNSGEDAHHPFALLGLDDIVHFFYNSDYEFVHRALNNDNALHGRTSISTLGDCRSACRVDVDGVSKLVMATDYQLAYCDDELEPTLHGYGSYPYYSTNSSQMYSTPDGAVFHLYVKSFPDNNALLWEISLDGGASWSSPQTFVNMVASTREDSVGYGSTFTLDAGDTINLPLIYSQGYPGEGKSFNRKIQWKSKPDRFNESDIFYAPTLVPGEVAVTQSARFDDPDVIYPGSVAVDGTIVPTVRFNDIEIFYAPTILRGTITLTPERFNDADVFYAPSNILPLTQTARFNDTDVIYSPTVTNITYDDITGLLYAEGFGTDTWTLSDEHKRPCIYGPYQASSGYHYAFGRHPTVDTTLRCIKTENPGWEDYSVCLDKTGYTTEIQDITAVQDGDIIHLCIIDGDKTAGSGAVNSARYLAFDMSSETILYAENIATNFDPSGDYWTQRKELAGSIAVRSNDEVVVFFNGQHQTYSGATRSAAFYSRRTGTDTWTSPTRVDDPSAYSGEGGIYDTANLLCILGKDDRVHFLYVDSPEEGDSGWHRSLDSDNTLDNQVAFGNRATWSFPAIDAYTRPDGEVSIGLLHNGAAGFWWFLSGANPTFNFEQSSWPYNVFDGPSSPMRFWYDDTGRQHVMFRADDENWAYINSSDHFKSKANGNTSPQSQLFVGHGIVFPGIGGITGGVDWSVSPLYPKVNDGELYADVIANVNYDRTATARKSFRAQTKLRPDQFDDVDIFYAPDISLGMSPSFFVDTDLFYAPAIAIPLIQTARFDDSDTFYLPTISIEEAFDDYWYGVALLAGFDEAVVDESVFQRGNADLFGNAQRVTDAPLISDASLLLPVTGDYASWPSDANLSIADDRDKTIEFRFKLDSLEADRSLIDKGEYTLEVLTDGTLCFRTYIDSVPDVEINTATGAVSAGVQYYVAMCRLAGVWKLFCGSGSTVDLVGSDGESAQPTSTSHDLTIG